MSKVAFFIGNLSIGGAEKVVSQLLNKLPEDIEKYLILGKDKIDFKYKGQLLVLGIEVSPNIFGASKNFILKWWRLRRFKKENHFSHTISFMEGSNIANILTKQDDIIIISVRTFVSSEDIKGVGQAFVRLLIRLLYNKADVIIAASKALKHDLIINYGIKENKVKVIYNPCDVESIGLLAKEKIDIFEKIIGNPIIVNTGRLTNAKGHRYLLRIFKEVKKEIPDCKLVLIGDGDLREYLLNYSKELKLKTYWIEDALQSNEKYDVYFLGFQKNPFKYMIKASLFAFPSIREGFPNALVEAMACGLPVISSDCSSGPREILAPDTDFTRQTKTPEFSKYGILLPVPDGNKYSPDEALSFEEIHWVNCIVQIMRDKSGMKQYAEYGKTRANDFMFGNVLKEWNELLNR